MNRFLWNKLLIYEQVLTDCTNYSFFATWDIIHSFVINHHYTPEKKKRKEKSGKIEKKNEKHWVENNKSFPTRYLLSDLKRYYLKECFLPGGNTNSSQVACFLVSIDKNTYIYLLLQTLPISSRTEFRNENFYVPNGRFGIEIFCLSCWKLFWPYVICTRNGID